MSKKRSLIWIPAFFLCAAQAYSSPSYTVIDLGSLQWAPPIPHPGALPGTTAYDRTPIGEVGQDDTQDPNIGPVLHAYLYRNLALTDLGVLPGAMGYTTAPQSLARALNTAAHVVGVSDSGFYHLSSTGKAATHAVLWNGAANDLGTLSGDPGYSSVAEGINDSEEIVGTSEIMLNNGQVTNRAFVWISGRMYNLTFYLVQASYVRLTEALQINCQGQISAVGYDARYPNVTRSYLLTRVGPLRSACQ